MCLLYMQFIISHILLAYAINGLQVPNPVFIIVASPLRSIQPWLLVRINASDMCFNTISITETITQKSDPELPHLKRMNESILGRHLSQNFVCFAFNNDSILNGNNLLRSRLEYLIHFNP